MTLDATYHKVRIDGVVRDCATLTAYGIRCDDGKRIILGVSCAPFHFGSRRRGIAARRDLRIAAAAAGQRRLPYMVENRPFCGLFSGVFERKIHPPFEVCSGKHLRFAVGAKDSLARKVTTATGRL
jgi:hypothetical protein